MDKRRGNYRPPTATVGFVETDLSLLYAQVATPVELKEMWIIGKERKE